MEFCDECGSMMKADDDVWTCTQCGAVKAKDPTASYVVTEGQEALELIERDGEAESSLPTTEARCPECSNDRAYWYLQQIRAADESETRFFVCTQCERKWREDDH